MRSSEIDELLAGLPSRIRSAECPALDHRIILAKYIINIDLLGPILFLVQAFGVQATLYAIIAQKTSIVQVGAMSTIITPVVATNYERRFEEWPLLRSSLALKVWMMSHQRKMMSLRYLSPIPPLILRQPMG